MRDAAKGGKGISLFVLLRWLTSSPILKFLPNLALSAGVNLVFCPLRVGTDLRRSRDVPLAC